MLLRLSPLQNNFRIPFTTPVRNNGTHCLYQISQDTVSFSGDNYTLTGLEKLEARKKLAKAANSPFEYASGSALNDKIETIAYNLTPKSYKFLDRILSLDNMTLDVAGNILNYIKQDNVSESEIAAKLKIIKMLPDRIMCIAQKNNSIFGKFYKYSFPQSVLTYEDLIKSDILLENKNPTLRSLDDGIKRLLDALERKHKKFKMTRNNTGLTRTADDHKRHIKSISNYTMKNFMPLLAMSMIMTDDAFNELWYNRPTDFNDVHSNRLRILTSDDFKVLKNIQEKGNETSWKKEGERQPGIVSLTSKVTLLNLLAANRKLVNAKAESVNLKEIMPHAFEDKPDKFDIDFEYLKEAFIVPALCYTGITKDVAQNYKKAYLEAKNNNFAYKSNKDFWDVNYVHLLVAEPDSKLGQIVRLSTMGDFLRYICDVKTSQGQKNKETEKAFKQNELSYIDWCYPSIPVRTASFTDKTGKKQKTFTVNMWDRIPQESLFDGNYTTCCTGIDKNHGQSFIDYMLNTSFNTIEVKTEKNKTIGMSRVFMAKINGEVSLVIENIEIANKTAKNYLHNDTNKQKYRELVFDYARDLAKAINKDPKRKIPVYFSAKYFKVKDIEKGLGKPVQYGNTNIREDDQQPEIIGSHPPKIYVNCWGDNLREIYDSDSPLIFHLIDVTKKTKKS